MGLFDKLFRKKKKQVPKTQAVRNIKTGPAGYAQNQLPVRGPPGGRIDGTGTITQRGVGGKDPRMNIDMSNIDPEVQRFIDSSVAKINLPKQPGEGVRPPSTKMKKVKKRVQSRRVSTKRKGQPMKTTAPAQTTTGSQVAAQGVPDHGVGGHFEDTLGEEELFKKLAQWEKNLKEKAPPAKATKTKAAQPPSDSDVKRRAIIDKELKEREKSLKKFEAKLREKEKRLKKMEDMNKLFTQLETPELEQFSATGELDAGGDAGVGVATKDGFGGELGAAAPRGEGVPDFEEMLQPIKNLTFTNFIVGPSNRFAHDVSLSVAKTPADAYNPLFIYSNVGLGKTHLLCAIGNHIQSKNAEARIVYVSSEKFTNELLDYLRLGEMEKFRTKYRNIDVLLIDDIQFIGGQEGTQEEFFHTFNSLYNAHKQIVITSDRPPKNIAHLKDRLRSRFEGGLIVNIKPPDLGTRTMILHEKAEKDGIYIPDEIINYMASKVKSNVRTLIGILNRVVAHSSLTDRDLDTALIDEVLQDVSDEGTKLEDT